ncbi:Actin-depolymerizing factor 8 [Phytophthora cinnamomi]|uniref:Actin-depolymerizing factor 8 n=1 Tax=Phytophthora cinnamomi TaxID=4785 RepID=UPI0035598F5B|nr:Actin-depolymerizing factor 8 [Phytophthora cinnamomi]
MVSSSITFSAVAALAIAVQNVKAHGYMYIPLAEFDGTATSSWIVQISPQWSGDWDSCSSDDSDCLTSVYTELKSSNGYSDIRTLLDSDTSLYGANCGYTDPDATAKDPPTTGDATFSRGMVHVGPCEIWLDDTMVLSNDDCMTAYGDGTVDTKSVFTPVDYSSCSTSGCMLRFYWLAFQGVDSEIVWQVYKDCVPLTGPAGGSSTSSTTTTSSTTSDTAASSTTENEADRATTTSTTSGDSTGTTTASSVTTSESTTESSTTTGETTTETPATTGDSTSAPSTGSATTGGDSWTSTGSTAATRNSGNSWTSAGSSTTTTTSGSNTQGNGNQGGNGWSGGFGGMGGGLRK